MQSHAPVLLDEVLEALNIDPRGTYVDGTFGRGGHSRAILQRLGPQGRLLAVDRDQAAIDFGRQEYSQEPRMEFVHSQFSELAEVVKRRTKNGVVHGILLDLGVSSPQLDNADRGFSFRADGPLDMRMDASQRMSAASWLAMADVREIRTVIKTYGEERFAHRIAVAIVARRELEPLTTTLQLAKLVSDVVPHKEQKIHPATRTFQAIRIFINSELEELKVALEQSIKVLANHGRLAVISFHSLEDRIVKRFMRDNSRDDLMYSGLPEMPESARATLKLTGKQVRATKEEIENNPRSRSAVLRVAERINRADQ